MADGEGIKFNVGVNMISIFFFDTLWGEKNNKE